MSQRVIDWIFTAASVVNQDGAHAAILQGGTDVPGPGATALGSRNTAVRFGPGVSCRATLSPGELDATRFCVRIAFRATAPVTTRGNLVESDALPFSLFVEPGAAADRFNVAAMVENGAAGWTGANTANRRALLLNQWYVASLIFDLDTVALLIDDAVVGVMAWPRGGLRAGTGDRLLVGTWLDGVRWPFTGEIAAVQVWRGIQAELEAKLDAERGDAEWHLTRKENEVRSSLNLGPKTGDFYYHPATDCYIQPYALASISFRESHGTAFVMVGAILAKWRSDENLRRDLGALASDEINGRRAGSRKSMFEKGCIYWSPASGAVPALGRIYLDFEALGEGSHAIGLPIADVQAISGGKVHSFQWGKMYLRNGAGNAFEVHGAILNKYETAGGPDRWGFPISHESDVLRGTVVAGKKSEFTGCTIYWSPATPASIIYGAIRERYVGSATVNGEGGPLGDLGFPTSDESDIPGVAGSRYNTFQNGSILWFQGPVYVCRPFTVFLGRLDTKEEDRDILDVDGQNDLYCRVRVDVNGGRVFDRKYPENSTHFSSGNVKDLNINAPYTITPNSAGLTSTVRVEIWESDSGQIFGGGDAHLGTMTKTLNIANAWGLRDNANGLFRASNFGPWVNYLDWSVKPRVGPNTPLDFWGVTNRGTTALDYREYAAAFSDVDPDFEVGLDIIDDGLKALYYELVVKGIANGGNCFGMSLEAIYAYKERSRLGRPLSRFTNWSEVENDFNVKHAYQVGADAIWWFMGQFLSGNTHDPMNVFQETWDAHARGENPVLCISQNYDFSGAPHCILPIGWDRNSNPWRIEVFDPNFMSQRRFVTVDPASNTFRYEGNNTGTRVYTGDAWSGGRLHYMPWGVVNHQQRTPVWDAILLLLGGVVVIFGDATDVESLSDEKGNRLDAASVTNRDHLKGKLLRVPGLSGAGPVRGGFYIGKQTRNPITFNSAAMSQALTASMAATTPMKSRAGSLSMLMATAPLIKPPVATDATQTSLAGPVLLDLMRQNGLAALRSNQPTDLDTIRANLKGAANGKLDAYHKRGLFGVRVQSDVAQGERVRTGFERMTGRDNEVSVQSDRARVYSVSVANKLGGGRDFLNIRLDGLAGEAGKQVRFNFQPGARAIDLVAGGAPADARVTVEGRIGGKEVKSGFNARLQGGQRLILPDLADPAVLKVGRIDNLLGVARDFQFVKRQ